MHTKGEWTFEQTPNGDYWDILSSNDFIGRIGNPNSDIINGESNAKRIVQMHNSFDDLVEASQNILDTIQSRKTLLDPMEKLHKAIANAENID